MEAVQLGPGDELSHLVAAAKDGDRFAFARLVQRDAHVAYRAALAVLHSAEDAEDAIQEATLRAWIRLPQLREPAGWPGWYRRIAVRIALDHAHRTDPARELAVHPAFLERNEPDPGPAADERLTILAALARLSPDDRMVLGLRFGADLEVPDLAATLGIRLGTAKARVHRALRRLARELTDDGDDDDR